MLRVQEVVQNEKQKNSISVTKIAAKRILEADPQLTKLETITEVRELRNVVLVRYKHNGKNCSVFISYKKFQAVVVEPVKLEKTEKETLREENEKNVLVIKETLSMMGGQSFEVINWLTFQAKINQGSKTLGFVGVTMMTGKPWFRPQDAKVSKSVQFPVDSLAEAVTKVILWRIAKDQKSV